MDWGLGRWKSRNPFLRNRLVWHEHKWVSDMPQINDVSLGVSLTVNLGLLLLHGFQLLPSLLLDGDNHSSPYLCWHSLRDFERHRSNSGNHTVRLCDSPSDVASNATVRRFQWAVLRLENEHLYNCGNFRAVKYVPVPFDHDHAPSFKDSKKNEPELQLKVDSLCDAHSESASNTTGTRARILRTGSCEMMTL